MNPFNLTKGQSKEADCLFNYLLKQHNHIAFSNKIGMEAFLVEKNLDQVNELLKRIEENQPKEAIRVTHSEDNNWKAQGTGLLLEFMEQGGMKWHWDIQRKRAMDKAKVQDEKERIEREALELDVELKKNILDDYPKTKARAKRNEIIAWASIFIALLAILLQFIMN